MHGLPVPVPAFQQVISGHAEGMCLAGDIKTRRIMFLNMRFAFYFLVTSSNPETFGPALLPGDVVQQGALVS